MVAPVSKHANKLTDEEKLQLCTWLAGFTSVEDVIRQALSVFGKSLTRTAVDHYRTDPKWQPLVQRCRTEWAQRVLEVPIAHQRERLERVQRLWDRAESDAQTPPGRKRMELLAYLKEAREEMAVHQPMVQQIYLTSITQASDDELWQRKDELVKRLEEGFPHGPRRRQSGVETPAGSREALSAPASRLPAPAGG